MTKALRKIHELGFLHLDVKPDNIITPFIRYSLNDPLTKIQSAKSSIYLIDFGCA